jgi:hypothetical protein
MKNVLVDTLVALTFLKVLSKVRSLRPREGSQSIVVCFIWRFKFGEMEYNSLDIGA